jgi:hypothetical protein
MRRRDAHFIIPMDRGVMSKPGIAPVRAYGIARTITARLCEIRLQVVVCVRYTSWADGSRKYL